MKEKLSLNGSKMSYFLKELNEIIKTAEETLTYQRVFELSGVSEILDTLYISTSDLNKSYVSLFFKTIKDFIKSPLYKDLTINKEEDLAILRKDPAFKTKIVNTIGKIESNLIPNANKLIAWIEENFDSGSEISLEKITGPVKYDKASLLFMLDDLKKRKKLYDFNGREVTLK